jgi:hypothetical protein
MTDMTKVAVDSGPYAAAIKGYSAPFSGAALLHAAEMATGLSDWGGRRWDEEAFRHDFSLLCEAIEATAEVSPVGRDRSHSRLFTMLVSRLRYIDARNATYGVDDQRIVAPLIGTGLPRAGTTFLHGLLAQDPANRVIRSFEAAIPVPIPTSQGDARHALFHDILDFQGLLDGAIASIHPHASDQPDECIFAQEGDCGSLYTVYWNVPDYQAAIVNKNPSAFRWQVGLMQYLQAIQPGGRWALKAPGHLFCWTEMRMAFPDAHLYVNHRDPGKVIPSLASLYMALRGIFSDTGSDPAQVGPDQLMGWSYAVNAYTDWRSGDGRDANVADIQFADLTARPIETVASLYDRFDIRFTDAAKEAMLRHMETDHHGKGPARTYTLAEFGIDEAAVEAAFGRYIDHFGINRETRA